MLDFHFDVGQGINQIGKTSNSSILNLSTSDGGKIHGLSLPYLKNVARPLVSPDL
jgi:hypothetical protein